MFNWRGLFGLSLISFIMPIPLALALPAIGGAVSAVGNILSQNSANSTNIQLMREQNAFNEYMYDKQYRNNIDFWKMQNEYNAPSAEVARLRDAGLNPALVFGKGAGAASVGLPSAAPAAGTSVSPSFTPAASDVLLNGLQNTLAASAQAIQIKDTHDSMVLDNQLKSATLKANIARAMQEVSNLRKTGKLTSVQESYYRALEDSLRRDIKFADATFNDRVDAVTLANQVAEENRDYLWSQSQLNLANKQMADLQPFLSMQQNSRDWQQLRGILADIDSQIGQRSKQNELTDKQISNIVADTFSKYRTSFSNAKTEGLVRMQILQDLDKGAFDKSWRLADKMFGYWSGFQQKLQGGAGAAAQMMRAVK